MNDLTQGLAPISTPPSIALTDFIDEFGDELLASLNRSNPPVYAGQPNPRRQAVMDSLKRTPFPAQAAVVQAIATLLLDRNEQVGIINAEMGTGKTMIAIALAAVMHAEGYRRTLVISPPHLVYKWRREILETVPDARVWVLNGPNTLAKLLKLRDQLGHPRLPGQEFFILGRVRMRMGYHWKPACWNKRTLGGQHLAACPDCGHLIKDSDDNPIPLEDLNQMDHQLHCSHCKGPLWTLTRPGRPKAGERRTTILKSMCRIPTIGPVRAERLLNDFGEDFLASMLIDNVAEFINLMDAKGHFIFSDRQAKRMERAMANIEFGFGEGGYQPSEFIKKQLPDGCFDLLVLDEGHEFKNAGSAQGQAMGVLAAKARKTVLLTGTLMGGYAEDLYYLLFRILTRRMIEDGYRPNARGSMAPAAMAFMRDHGVLKDIYTERNGESHKTAKGKKLSVRTVKAPGFGPKGILRFVLPFTAFLKLKDIGGNVLPNYQETFIDVPMTPEQASTHRNLASALTTELRQALARRDNSLQGVVLNVLQAWPDCCFRPEVVKHPRSRETLAFVPALFGDETAMPKEYALMQLCLDEKAKGRKVLAYTVYSGTRDTTARLKRLLKHAGLKVAVLRASVDTTQREDWILDQVDRGIDVLITNPELVKTGLDLLDFPTIAFLQTGFNLYTLQQAARRSWRIGQKHPVHVVFFGYADSSQITCLQLMAKKIAVAQSTSGDIPDSGLDALNQDGESIEMALARQLVNT
ncbi:DEAD/DEAH box helicase [Pseudomonas protegens]|uniref:DEAD/DEAH box helicase n=1 Tax=Pseudomonas protegens TaxID=380021 RepID=A0A2T6GAW3_9PSED|nr:DEAD/DEAH box helicase [Pseudomonas protegens]PUA41282.1 DEAD/DEAH box helicase [Pseudomonas protegens]